MKVLQIYKCIEDSSQDTVYVKAIGKDWSKLIDYLTEYRYLLLDRGKTQEFIEVGEYINTLDSKYLSEDLFNERHLKEELEKISY